MLTSRRYQDENSDYGKAVKTYADQENQQSSLKTGGRAGLKSARKGLQALGASNLPASRRALGDITNATPVNKSGPPLKGGLEGMQAKAAQTAAKAQAEKSKEEIWAEEGIEQLAGKSWQVMEEEQRAEEMQQITARVQRAVKQAHGQSRHRSAWNIPRLAPIIARPPSRSPSPLQGDVDGMLLDSAALLPSEEPRPILQCCEWGLNPI